ncbi:thioesterase family protein [Actinokineospora bangkokensis]|uniref:Thioesterase n=1 Tax=Actinokineospora bangkokensis TaxID=1193682 RepID=A0A1Q9LPR4_9PSEU|nr:thioesterase family protein [Actinokineospora bangkokensis]OLR94015.1 thioesterase [Actinokineospora bangkokensis]
MTAADSYFVRTGDTTFLPTVHTGGAWNTAEQHISPLIGLLAHAVDRGAPSDKVVSRVSVDILGVIGMAEFEVAVRVLRPGRTVELVEATASAAGRSVAVARVWRLSTSDTAAVAGGAGPALPPPHDLPPHPITELWPGGYIEGVDLRVVSGPEPGRVVAWLRTPTALVRGERVSPVARFLGLVDTANGIAVREHPAKWAFPNLDLTVHLFRQPEGEWVGFDTSVVFGATGQGLTSTTLHDLRGPVGRAEQVLTVRPLA